VTGNGAPRGFDVGQDYHGVALKIQLLPVNLVLIPVLDT
jgi:hypothetical protein